VNLLGDNTETRKKSTETSIDSSKEVGLEVNVEKIKYILMSHHQNAGQNWDIKIANRLFGNMAFKLFGNDSNKSNFASGVN
jgi:hypothetical protein